MKQLLIEPDFSAWREAARAALLAGYRPEELDLQDATQPGTLSLALSEDERPTGVAVTSPHTSRAFLDLAQQAAVHRDPQRWNLLYRLLYRLQSDRDLLRIEVDPDVSQLMRLSAQVHRDLHKMHAFVRFRKVLEPGDPSERPVVLDEPVATTKDPAAHHLVLATPTPFGTLTTELNSCEPAAPLESPAVPFQPLLAPPAAETTECEHFIAWYQPDHRIVPLAAPFFAERFSIMRWTILTPDASVAWDPISRQLAFGPGVPREAAPAEDELEDLWRSYYSSIFNPARLNPQTMRGEMPVRYWKNLPEVSVIPALITNSRTRVESMVTRQQQQATAQPFVPADHSIPSLNSALPSCKGCELYCNATQVVPGVGPHTAALMLVGEQPGDQEDRQGLPFVGPAGRVLDEVLADLRIDRSQVYLTNAVKHFKFVQRGKLRLHQNPRLSEIMACRPWLLAEIESVRPKVIVCLGASASKSLLGGTFALMRDRGKLLSTPFADQVLATIHPSAVLRARDNGNGEELRRFLAEDLALAFRTAHG